MTEFARAAAGRGGGRQGNGVSAVDATASQILDLIRERGLGVGDVLPTERDLCELVGASRNTVREALRTIRTYGLIEARQRVGAVLTDRQGAAVRNFLTAHMDVSRSSFRDIQGFRRLVEVGIGDHLVLHMTEADLEALDTVNGRILESRSAEDAARYDFEFHSTLIGLAGNRTLAEMYSFLSPVILRIMTTGKEKRPVLSHTQSAHAEIVGALRSRDRLAYAYLMSRHLDFGLQFLPKESSSSTTQGSE